MMVIKLFLILLCNGGMRVILYKLGQITTYPLVVWPKFKLPIVIWNLTLYPPKVSLVRVLLPNSVKNKGKYVILLHLYVFLLQKYKKKKKNKRNKIKNWYWSLSPFTCILNMKNKHLEKSNPNQHPHKQNDCNKIPHCIHVIRNLERGLGSGKVRDNAIHKILVRGQYINGTTSKQAEGEFTSHTNRMSQMTILWVNP